MSSLSELMLQLKQNKNWDERQRIAQEIIRFGDEAINPVIEIWSEFLAYEDYFDEEECAGEDCLKDSNLHSIAEDILVVIGSSAVEALIPLLNSENWGERFGAIHCLHHIGDTRAILPMIRSLESADMNAVGEIADALEYFGSISIVPMLEAAKGANPKIRKELTTCLGRFGQNETISVLESLAKFDAVSEVRVSAIFSLSHLQDKRVTRFLKTLLSDANPHIREAVAMCLGRFGQNEAIPALEGLALRDSSVDVRIAAIDSLSDFSDESVTRFLKTLLEDENAEIRQLVQDILDER